MYPLVSVIIPVYNSSLYLETCLNSVIRQSYKFIEVVIINDGSTDNSEEIISKFIEDDSRIKYHTQKNHGLGYTRNRGMSLCSGKYIFFLDSDDVLPPKAIELLVKAIRKNNADYAVGKVLRFNSERKYIPVRHKEFNLYNKNMTTDIYTSPELLQDSIACNKLWNKEFLNKQRLLFQEGKYYEDLMLTLKAAIMAEKIEIISDVVYYWRVREDKDKPSITQQQMNLDNTSDRIKMLTKNREWLKSLNIDSKIIEENDLKSLLDILRLHVLKFAMVKEEEREEWKSTVVSFIKQIPVNIAEKLPDKEKKLYDMLIRNDIEDLLLFSQMLTNTENVPLVTQENNSFIFNGKNRSFDVSQMLKPVIIVNKITQIQSQWKLSGKLLVPKASKEIRGILYGTNRLDQKTTIIGNLDTKLKEINRLYQAEEQTYSIIIEPSIFLKNNGKTYDLYFCLADYPSYQSARVRVHPSVKLNKKIKNGKIIYILYQTKYGNLSIKVKREKMYTYLRKNIKKLIKKLLPKNPHNQI